MALQVRCARRELRGGTAALRVRHRPRGGRAVTAPPSLVRGGLGVAERPLRSPGDLADGRATGDRDTLPARRRGAGVRA
ncbi:hypothetical protein OG194_15915 [Streptomyces sp. NBC_01288]|uniref:hypothetical protein n=1 Tax=Streptomyces sp. NBC_01288 TaxID=2903814 RepID=UPI002E11AE2A|nr:hypothetical protein OG194_15915 [Streptomyces sp. NBC_01288]